MRQFDLFLSTQRLGTFGDKPDIGAASSLNFQNNQVGTQMNQSKNSYYDQVNDRLVINTDFSDIKSDYADLRLLIHDINSAANTFHLLVEEIATDLKPELTNRQYKKIQQLRNHATLNKIILKKISESIAEFLMQGTSK